MIRRHVIPREGVERIYHIKPWMNMNPRKKVAGFRLDEKTWEAFVSLVTERGLTPSEVLRRFVVDYVEKHGGDKKR